MYFEDEKYKSIRSLLNIPIYIATGMIFILFTAMAVEMLFGENIIYSTLAVIFIVALFLQPIPNLIISIIGTVKAAKAKYNGLIFMGIVEIILSLAIPAMVAYVLITTEAGV